MKKFLPDWFITGLVLMILVAWIRPGIGMGTTPVDLGTVVDIGVMLIFFFYGIKLDTRKLKTGMRNWKMHLAVQLTTFLLFPLLVLPFYPMVKGTGYELIWLGTFFLAALPSTVSSSVVMVSIAGGNIPGAIFNASISGIIGIVMTPFWMSFFLNSQATGTDTGHILLQLITRIIVPVIAGILLHAVLYRHISKYLVPLATFDKVIILLIVYESFSHSFLDGLFSGISWTLLATLFVVVILLFFVVLNATRLLAHKLVFPKEDRITLQFAGTKKSLVHGSVFANVLFSGISGTGVLLLPIMIYHSFQLFYISILARNMQRQEASTRKG